MGALQGKETTFRAVVPAATLRDPEKKVQEASTPMGTIRSELKRFERRRLRPLFRLFRLGQSRPRIPALIAEGAAPATATPMTEIEELLVAMIRDQVRRGDGARAAAAGTTGSVALDDFVRAMMAGRVEGGPVSPRQGAA